MVEDRHPVTLIIKQPVEYSHDYYSFFKDPDRRPPRTDPMDDLVEALRQQFERLSLEPTPERGTKRKYRSGVDVVQGDEKRQRTDYREVMIQPEVTPHAMKRKFVEEDEKPAAKRRRTDHREAMTPPELVTSAAKKRKFGVERGEPAKYPRIEGSTRAEHLQKATLSRFQN